VLFQNHRNGKQSTQHEGQTDLSGCSREVTVPGREIVRPNQQEHNAKVDRSERAVVP
jgi:hypothetical protein